MDSNQLIQKWQDPIYRENMRQAHLGQKSWNKGLKIRLNSGKTHFKKGHKKSKNWYKVMAIRMNGKSNPSYKHGLSGTLELARILVAKRRARKLNNGGSFTVKEWDDLKKCYGFKCLACRKIKKLAADHVIPITKGGPSYISNIQPLCISCNAKKYNKIVDYRILWTNQKLQ